MPQHGKSGELEIFLVVLSRLWEFRNRVVFCGRDDSAGALIHSIQLFLTEVGGKVVMTSKVDVGCRGWSEREQNNKSWCGWVCLPEGWFAVM